MSKKLTTEEFIEKAQNKFGNLFDYSKTVYVSSNDQVTIICNKHGEFKQRANNHLAGNGCVKCAKEKTTKTIEKFIIDANKIHKNKYNYDKTIYENRYSKVIITCPVHGDFEQIPHDHLAGHGCGKCNYSKGELLIYNWLKENNIPFKSQFELITNEIARNSNLMIIDFFVKYKEQQYFIEYDGKQHYEYVPFFHQGGIIDFEKQQRRDKVLNEFCELHKDKITLIRFKYDENDEEIINKLNEIL